MRNVLITLHDVYLITDEDVVNMQFPSEDSTLEYISECESKSCISADKKDTHKVWHINHDDFEDHVYEVLNGREPVERW